MNSYCVICRKDNIRVTIVDGLSLCSICTMKKYDDNIFLKIIRDKKKSLKLQIEELDKQEKIVSNKYKMKKRKR